MGRHDLRTHGEWFLLVVSTTRLLSLPVPEPMETELDYDQRIRAEIDRRQERVDWWWQDAVVKLTAKHGAADFWGVPAGERHALMKKYTEKSRAAHGKDPKWGDPSSELTKEIREEAGVASIPPPRVERPAAPEAQIPCIEAPDCKQLAKTERGMRKHIKFRHPARTEAEMDEFFAVS
jgi:hypothetical protein